MSDWAELTVRADAMALPPSDYGSARAVQSAARLVRAAYDRGRGEVELLIHTPEIAVFENGVRVEAAHQRERWGADHDAGKTPFDWFWLVGYLAQKAAAAAVAGDIDKARHHTISTAAALSNWHLALSGGDNRMRPGIAPPEPDAARRAA